jgi:YHS domain-containing protein
MKKLLFITVPMLVVPMLIVPMLMGLAIAPSAFAADQPGIATVLAAPAKADIGTKTQCAVCGMKLRVKADQAGAEYKGKDYYFCDANERDAFVQSPSTYLKK